MENEITPWQQALADAFTNVEDLCRHLHIAPESVPILSHYKPFPLRVPRGYVACMEPGNPEDPLLKQVLPLHDELRHFPGYNLDPVGDLQAIAAAGVLHKYHARVLLILTGACAIHCRYCFRRNFPYSDVQLSGQKMHEALAYIESRPEINEAILSGGDPLLLNDDKLGTLLDHLGSIPHLRRIRIHSRVPIVLPCRISKNFLKRLTGTGKEIVLVLHANHYRELSAEVDLACRIMRQAQITLLNQSVLLKGVNDNAESLCQLSEQLFSFGVLPYYLHMLDHASGTSHFAVAKDVALDLINILHRRLPGYLVPKLVREQPGAPYKIPISAPGPDEI